MPLYRRVFPVWHPRTWDPNGEEVRPKRAENFDAEEQ